MGDDLASFSSAVAQPPGSGFDSAGGLRASRDSASVPRIRPRLSFHHQHVAGWLVSGSISLA